MSEVISSEDFQSKVLKADKPVLVDFFATWCGPCQMVEPVMEEVEQEVADRVDVCRIDVDQSPEIAMRYSINSVPTIALFEDGQIVRYVIGAQPKQSILALLS